jgi:hypothetical protein
MESFELSHRMRPPVFMLPAVELAIATCLVFAYTSQQASIASCVLLVIFCVVVARSARRRRATSCNCFGTLPLWTDRLAVAAAKWRITRALAWRGHIFKATKPVLIPPGPGQQRRYRVDLGGDGHHRFGADCASNFEMAPPLWCPIKGHGNSATTFP